jgi:hypothetical protein
MNNVMVFGLQRQPEVASQPAKYSCQSLLYQQGLFFIPSKNINNVIFNSESIGISSS